MNYNNLRNDDNENNLVYNLQIDNNYQINNSNNNTINNPNDQAENRN